MILNEINKKLLDVKNELSLMSNLYDLHIIEVINIFNNSLLQAYNLKSSDYLVNLTIKNQIIFYHLFEKRELFYNLSKKKFNIFFKIFNENILEKNENNMIKSFYNSLSKQRYIELIIKEKSRRLLTLIPKNERGLYRYLVFKYPINSDIAKDFISKNETFWIRLSQKNLNQIKNLEYKKKNITLECDIMDIHIVKLIINHFFKEIKEKTKNKFILRIKFIDKKNKIVSIICSEYLPSLFIKYIEIYIYNNTNYKVNFVK